MSFVALAIGLVLVAEGLALALAPARVMAALARLAAMPAQGRRLFGLAALAAGVGLIWIGRALDG